MYNVRAMESIISIQRAGNLRARFFAKPMKTVKHLLVWLLVLHLSGLAPLLAQPVLIQPNDPFAQRLPVGSGVENLRVVEQNTDGTEALLTMDYTYDGFAGPIARLLPVIGKRNERGVSGWFGADPVTVGRGRGTISIKVRYFNDEPGVPPMFTSDQVRILVLNQMGTAQLSVVPFLKTIKWGSATARPAVTPPAVTAPIVSIVDQERVKKLAEEKRRAEEQARAEVEAREKARLVAEAEAKTRQEAEQKAKAEALARDVARQKAEAEAQRIAAESKKAEELKVAQERALALEKQRAETEAKRLAEEKRIAEEKERSEALAREEARKKAEGEELVRKAAETKALAEAQAREEVRRRAEAESRRLAEEKRLADERTRKEAEEKEKTRLAAEARMREQERSKAEAEAKRLAQERRIAEEKARAEALARDEARKKAATEELARKVAEAKAVADANAREDERLRAESEAKRLEEERKLAEAKRLGEETDREIARLKAEVEARRLANEKRAAEEKALVESKAREEAEARVRQEALAQTKAEEEARKLAEEKKQAEALVQAAANASGAAGSMPSLEMAQGMKTKITNVDVVNRSMDRTSMTFGVEFEYKDQISNPLVGVDVFRQADPGVGRYFLSKPSEIGRSRRNFALFPVKFQPPTGAVNGAGFHTDKVMVYLQEKESARRYNIFPATMLLMWRAPGSQAAAGQTDGNSVEIDDFKQNDASNGYVSIKYNLLSGQGRLRAKVYSAEKPESAAYFASATPNVKAGRGLQLIDVKVDENSKSPTDLVPADTIEIELLDSNGKVLAKISKQTAMVWSKPK